MSSDYDVVVVGGGPAGLSAALALGRARKRVLLCDGGPRRNQRASHMHNFVTRDGIAPAEFRQIGRQQLAPLNVELRDLAVTSISGERGRFLVNLNTEQVVCKRVLLCTGMIDELPEIPGLAELWGHVVFQCPYCHGWENQDQQWGYMLREGMLGHLVPFVLQLRGWTDRVVVFANGVQIPPEAFARLKDAGIAVVEPLVVELETKAPATQLANVVLADGRRVPCDTLFVHPPQRQVSLVSALALVLDAEGLVVADPVTRQTSMAGVYAAGDLTTRMQAAIVGASAGMHAAAMINADLSMNHA